VRRQIDDTIRDIVHALRAFRRAPLAAFTIVVTVALGLGLVAVAFTVLNFLVFRVDAVPRVHEMFAVERPRTSGERLRFTREQLDVLRRETTIFSDAYAQVADVDSPIDGRLMYGTFVTGNFFQVLDVTASIGRTLTPSDEESEEPAIVLSHRGWDRLFARDPAVVGQHLIVNGFRFEIVGVMPEGFRGLMVAPDDYWAPLSTLDRVRPIEQGQEFAIDVDIIGRLKPGISPQEAVAQLAVWDGADARRRLLERGTSQITLTPRRGTVPHPADAVPITAPLFFAFGLILLIGCANVANLLLARAVARQREIGIQLSLGASRRRIVRQLLTESLLLALVAAGAGFAISRIVLELTINAVMANMPPDIGDVRLLVPGADWRVLLFLIAGALVATIAFALPPALRGTRIEPLRTMRGEVIGEWRPGRARTFLIGLQVSASALLLICAAVFLRSAFAAATFDPGLRTADTLVVQIVNEQHRGAIVQALTAEPLVAVVAASSPDIAPRAGVAESDGVKAKIAYRSVSPECFEVLGIPIVRGRAFTSAERMPHLPIAIVSETAARTMWPHADAVGQAVRLDDGLAVTVIGVARDVAGFRIAPFEKAVVYMPTNTETAKTSLFARVRGDSEVARQTLVNRLATIDPNMARQVITMRTIAGMDTLFLRIGFWMTVVLGGLALALTLSGVFSVLSYLVEQRTKEIGVRMALGATTGDVARLIVSQSIRPVAFGLLIGGGSATGIATLLLTTPAAAEIGELVRVLDPIAYVASLLIIIAACFVAASIPAARAARLDPTVTLRQE
jgi:predicted permease